MNQEQQLLNELKELDIEYCEETTFGNYTINIIHDEMAESPREWDNLGTMVCWHSRSNLGDVQGRDVYSETDQFWFDLAGIEYDYDNGGLERAKKLALKTHIILPLYLYEHSGMTIRTSSFSCPWDSGQLGWIYVSLERVRNDFGCKRVSKKQRALVEKYLTGEVETYDQYLTGEVYGYTLTHTDEDGEEDLDSCWGYFGYGDKYLIDEIKGNIEYDIKHRPLQLDLQLPESKQMELSV